MGNVSATMKSNMEQNSVRMVEFQRAMALKQRETQMALELARAKDRFHFFCGLYSTVFCAGLTAAFHLRNPAPLIGPLIPLTWAFAFQYDLVYGNKLERIMAETNRLLIEEPERFAVPKTSLILQNPEDYETIIMEERRARNAALKSAGLA
jgi:hypothetical protein